MKLRATGIFRNPWTDASNLIELENNYLSRDKVGTIFLNIIHDDRQPATGRVRRRQRQIIELTTKDLVSMLEFSERPLLENDNIFKI